ncbi:hypothetical protein [Mesorhizobium sp. CA16]|uniref:hypothetical protein n=1 Tax=Mesorhizobium sp. CA16 TaxID=588496 RepID=UPI001CCB66FF|nr:hypothetical protein [Mesorhizobium sp. CA16]MBZ9911380.1 hypothetical protein [Mesorhizobium sp. CA16]
MQRGVDDGTELSDWDSESAQSARLEDFFAYMPQHRYIFAPTRELWPASSVNARVSPIPLQHTDGSPKLNAKGEVVFMPASAWLDRFRPVEQLTWYPGEPMLMRDRLIAEGGFIMRAGSAIFNLYRPPAVVEGDPGAAGPWLDHIAKSILIMPIISSAGWHIVCRNQPRRSTMHCCSAARQASARIHCLLQSLAQLAPGILPK